MASTAAQITDSVLKGHDAEIANTNITGTLDVSGITTLSGGTTASVANALTALAGGAQAGTALTASYSRFTIVVTGGDSAQLPTALAGMSRFVKNTAANSMNIFPKTGEVINALAANAAYALATVKSVEFRCVVAGTWETLLTA